MEEKGISRAVIKRLPRYYRYLGELLEDGVERISSGELSERMKVTASQIRQDLNNFGGFAVSVQRDWKNLRSGQSPQYDFCRSRKSGTGACQLCGL